MYKIQMLQEIYNQLSIIVDAVSNKSIISNIVPWALGLISSSVGALIGYKISSKQEKKKFIRDSHFEYMKLTNIFNTEINKIIMSMDNIQKMGMIIIGDYKLYEPYFYGNLNDYLSISYKIRSLRKYIDSLNLGDDSSYSSKKHYKEQIILLSNDILEFNKIVEICTEYQREALNYYYFIDKSLRVEHAEIINTISNATKQNMDGFNIEDFRNKLVEHIRKINEFIMEKKINEPNLFNQDQEIIQNNEK